MIHQQYVETIRRERQHGDLIYPAYGSLSIAEVVPSILSLFGIDNGRATLPRNFFQQKHRENQKVILFMVDGVGLDHFTEYNEHVPFFKLLNERADIYPITSVFPSTTPAALTTLHTGFTPQEHGLPEWTVYFEEFDRIIETFPFRPLMTADRETLLTMGGEAEMLYKGNTIYQELRTAGIPSYVFSHHEYAASAYSRMSQQGSNVIAFSDFPDLLRKLKDAMTNKKGPAYFFVYWGHIDSTQHAFGPRSPEHEASMQSFSQHMLDDFFRKLTAEQVKDTLYLQVADHGHVSIEGEKIIYLNNYLKLEESYQWGTAKQSIHPTGSPHDVFLHIYGPKVDEVLAFLQAELEGKAEVMTTREAVKRGLFGLNEPSERFLKRIGNILILPHAGHHVWYKHSPSAQYGQKGIHGGLTEAEMIVPFVVSNLADLL